MPDLAQTLARLMRSGEIESARLEIVLKPQPKPPAPDSDLPKAVITIGPVTTKER